MSSFHRRLTNGDAWQWCPGVFKDRANKCRSYFSVISEVGLAAVKQGRLCSVRITRSILEISTFIYVAFYFSFSLCINTVGHDLPVSWLASGKCLQLCVCVCVRVSERERKRGRVCEREIESERVRPCARARDCQQLSCRRAGNVTGL